jgi:hypothetical protein
MARVLTEERAASHGIMPDPPTQGPAGPSHDDIRMAARKMVELQVERENVSRKISAYRKSLKAEGFTLGVLDAVVKMLDWTPEEIKNHYAERNWYAEAMRFPVGSQLEFFGTDATPDAVKEQLKWKQIGFKDGVAGKGWANEPPKGCPPEAVQSYGAGHEEGQETVRRAYLEKQKTLQAVKPDPSVELQADETEEAEDADDIEDTLDEAARRLKRSGFMEAGAAALDEVREVA